MDLMMKPRMQPLGVLCSFVCCGALAPDAASAVERSVVEAGAEIYAQRCARHGPPLSRWREQRC